MKKDLRAKVVEYIENNQPEMYWDYNDSLSKDQVSKILESEDGLMDLENELYEMNLDYLWDIENDFLKSVYDDFEVDIDFDDFKEDFQEYVCIDMNFNQLLSNTPDITALILVHSNYDCATSMSDINESESYLNDVWLRSKTGCLKKDFQWEASQIYGGSLLAFVFKTDVKNLIDIKSSFKTSITIPKGTQYGFFSSFVGSGSPFERITHKAMTLPKLQPNATEYDCIDIIADFEQSYTMDDVYGGTSFVDDQNITVS